MKGKNNNFEKYLLERAIPSDLHLEKVKNQGNQDKIAVNITNYLVFWDVRKILE